MKTKMTILRLRNKKESAAIFFLPLRVCVWERWRDEPQWPRVGCQSPSRGQKVFTSEGSIHGVGVRAQEGWNSQTRNDKRQCIKAQIGWGGCLYKKAAVCVCVCACAQGGEVRVCAGGSIFHGGQARRWGWSLRWVKRSCSWGKGSNSDRD